MILPLARLVFVLVCLRHHVRGAWPSLLVSTLADLLAAWAWLDWWLWPPVLAGWALLQASLLTSLRDVTVWILLSCMVVFSPQQSLVMYYGVKLASEASMLYHEADPPPPLSRCEVAWLVAVELLVPDPWTRDVVVLERRHRPRRLWRAMLGRGFWSAPVSLLSLFALASWVYLFCFGAGALPSLCAVLLLLASWLWTLATQTAKGEPLLLGELLEPGKTVRVHRAAERIVACRELQRHVPRELTFVVLEYA